jgi:hypothetical protein
MGFRIQFLDENAETIKELHSSARTASDALKLLRDEDWPVRAIRLVVRDVDGMPVAEGMKHEPPVSSEWRRYLRSGKGSAQ